MPDTRSMFAWPLWATVALVAVATGACARQETSPPPIEDTVFDSTVESLERARAVEDIALQRKDALDERMREGEE
jgi:hypothetical protein